MYQITNIDITSNDSNLHTRGSITLLPKMFSVFSLRADDDSSKRLTTIFTITVATEQNQRKSFFVHR